MSDLYITDNIILNTQPVAAIQLTTDKGNSDIASGGHLHVDLNGGRTIITGNIIFQELSLMSFAQRLRVIWRIAQIVFFS